MTTVKNMQKRRRKRVGVEPLIFHAINFTFLFLLCAAMIYPILNTVAISFNDGLDAVRGGIGIWPREFTVENYRTVFNMHTIPRAFQVSVARTVVNVVLNILFTSMLAFAISRSDFVFRKPITLIAVLTMYFNAGLIPNFILIQSLGLMNTFAVYWVPSLISAFNLILIRTYMRGVPESLVESARLDGAGDFRIYWQVIMPLCKPTLATVALFVAVGAWNDWWVNFLYVQRPDLQVLQRELMRLMEMAAAGQQAQAAVQAGMGNVVTPLVLRSTITVVAAVPILLVYPFLQKYFVQGVQLGGVKE